MTILYKIYPNFKKLLIERTLVYITSIIVLYLLININFQDLNINIINWKIYYFSFVIIFFLIEITMLYVNEKNYEIFVTEEEINWKSKSIKHSDIKEIKVVKGLFDNIFKTGSIVINKKHFIPSIENPDDITEFINSLNKYNGDRK